MNDHKGYKDETQITVETIKNIYKRFIRKETSCKTYDASVWNDAITASVLIKTRLYDTNCKKYFKIRLMIKGA